MFIGPMATDKQGFFRLWTFRVSLHCGQVV
jgi:hypothetical protein